ncbi:MAG TPA: serine/threonine-protein kinase [Polyangiaceae bacterium]
MSFAGRYEILSVLAKGGQGIVYVALDLARSTRVALKVVDSAFCVDRDPHTRLMREAKIGSCLECENVVEVFDAGWDERTGCSYLAMELLVGRDLQRVVSNDWPLAPSTVVDYLRQVASGLDRAHGFRIQRGGSSIVHRDLKPANLFLCDAAEGKCVVKILDFGVAKILERFAPNSIELRGTPLYMAPEQLVGAAVTPATDIWAFGLVAFFLLTGRSYWMEGQPNSGSLPRLFAEILTDPLVPPSVRVRQLGLVCDLAAAFDAWFLRCCHRDPTRRFRSAGRALRALAKVMKVPLEATRSSSVREWLLWLRACCASTIGDSERKAQWFWLVMGAIAGFVAIMACGVVAM